MTNNKKENGNATKQKAHNQQITNPTNHQANKLPTNLAEEQHRTSIRRLSGNGSASIQLVNSEEAAKELQHNQQRSCKHIKYIAKCSNEATNKQHRSHNEAKQEIRNTKCTPNLQQMNSKEKCDKYAAQMQQKHQVCSK